MHFHYVLFAEMLLDLAQTVASLPEPEFAHRTLREAAKVLYLRLKRDERGDEGTADLAPEQSVRLLHIME
jgi:hypothetical protein